MRFISIENGQKSLAHHEEPGNPDERDRNKTALIDCLTDLMHWADAFDVSFDNALRTARSHFDAEQRGES